MSFSRLALISLVLNTLPSTHAAFFYPNVQESLIEHEFVDAHGAHRSGFIDAITPCLNYVSGPKTVGRQTAAQWVRVSFHDFVTHHTSDGSGGLDASIGFETERDENVGAAMNDTIRFFRNRVSSKVSSADFLALSVVAAVGNCGGPQIPMRYGRKDATGPGPTGVPSPTTSLTDTLSMFGGAGMSQTEAISLVACGHTFGGVHHGVFPDVVGPEAVTPSNTAGGVNFDSSPDVFDNSVIKEYVDGTGTKGGTLVTTPNITSQSDLRLFTSDKNVTMKSLYKLSNAGFIGSCGTLFSKMLNTVPNGVTLSTATGIVPQIVKPVNTTLDFSGSTLIFKGYIRALLPTSSFTTDALPTMSLTYNDISKRTIQADAPLTPESATGASLYGTTTFYTFSTSITSAPAFTSFTVTLPGYYDRVFSVQTASFVVPSLTKVTQTSTGSVTVAFTVAVYSGAVVKRTGKRDVAAAVPIVNVAVPVNQPNTLGPKITTFSKVALTSAGTKAGYTLYSGSVTADAWTAGGISVSIVNSAGSEIDVLMVGGT